MKTVWTLFGMAISAIALRSVLMAWLTAALITKMGDPSLESLPYRPFVELLVISAVTGFLCAAFLAIHLTRDIKSAPLKALAVTAGLAVALFLTGLLLDPATPRAFGWLIRQ